MYAVVALALFASCVSAGRGGNDLVVGQRIISGNTLTGQLTLDQAADYNTGSTFDVVNQRKQIFGAPLKGQRIIIGGTSTGQINQAPLYNEAANAITQRGYIVSSPFGEQRVIIGGTSTGQINQAPLYNEAANAITRRGYIVSSPIGGQRVIIGGTSTGQINQAPLYNEATNAITRRGYIVSSPFGEQRVISGDTSTGNVNQAAFYNEAANAITRQGYIVSAPLGAQRVTSGNTFIRQVNQAPLYSGAANVIQGRGYIIGAPVIDNTYLDQFYVQNKRKVDYSYLSAPWARTGISTIEAPTFQVLHPNKLHYSALQKIGQQAEDFSSVSRPGYAYTYVKPPFSAPYAFVSGPEADKITVFGNDFLKQRNAEFAKVKVGKVSSASLHPTSLTQQKVSVEKFPRKV